jgi:hypothetical protein
MAPPSHAPVDRSEQVSRYAGDGEEADRSARHGQARQPARVQAGVGAARPHQVCATPAPSPAPGPTCGPARIRLDHPDDHPDDPSGSIGSRLDRRGTQREQARSVWSRPVRRRGSGSYRKVIGSVSTSGPPPSAFLDMQPHRQCQAPEPRRLPSSAVKRDGRVAWSGDHRRSRSLGSAPGWSRGRRPGADQKGSSVCQVPRTVDRDLSYGLGRGLGPAGDGVLDRCVAL